MPIYNCIIVEDEPLAAEILQDYIGEISFLKLIAVCPDAIYAIDLLSQQKIDLIFLDINLPKLKGLDFVKTLQDSPKIILTTAYQEYALQSYDLNVCDYLLKPIEFTRFLAAVNKFYKIESHAPTNKQSSEVERKYVFFNVNKKMVKIYLEDILYIESLKEYIRIVTNEKTIVTKYQLGQIEDQLMENDFLRIHRSFIVAKNKIEAYSNTEIEIGKKALPIGRSYKDIVVRALQV